MSDSIKNAINLLQKKQNLTREMASIVLNEMMSGNVASADIENILIGLAEKGETVLEITGFVEAMRNNALLIDLQNPNIMDTCGTGGDGGKTYNISTAVAFVLAAEGVPVAKHGNRAVSGTSGSIDVLEALNISLTPDVNIQKQIFDNYNLVFLFAQHHHPAMRFVGPVRQKLKRRTIFNMIGPLSNPALAKRQLIGVFAPDLLNKLAQALVILGTDRTLLVHSDSGMDELDLFSNNNVSEVNNGKIINYTVNAKDLGLKSDISIPVSAGDANNNAKTILDIFQNKANLNDYNLLLLNAGAAFYTAGVTSSIIAGVEKTKLIIDSGKVWTFYNNYTKFVGEVVK